MPRGTGTRGLRTAPLTASPSKVLESQGQDCPCAFRICFPKAWGKQGLWPGLPAKLPVHPALTHPRCFHLDVRQKSWMLPAQHMWTLGSHPPEVLQLTHTHQRELGPEARGPVFASCGLLRGTRLFHTVMTDRTTPVSEGGVSSTKLTES